MDWFEDQLGDFDDDSLLIDCPGQIELYTHSAIMKQIVSFLQRYVTALVIIRIHSTTVSNLSARY